MIQKSWLVTQFHVCNVELDFRTDNHMSIRFIASSGRKVLAIYPMMNTFPNSEETVLLTEKSTDVIDKSLSEYTF